jgi:CHAD domain-containing protein
MARAAPAAARPPALSANDDARVAARRVLGFHLATFQREEPAARSGDVEAVHQLRVASRRLRATLQLFAPVLPAAVVGSATEGLGWLGRGIGGVRDLDVLSLAIAARSRRLPDDARAALGPLEHALLERRAVALAELGRLLDTARSRRVLSRLGQLVLSRPGVRGPVRLGDVADKLMQPLLRAVQRAGRDLDAETPAVALHRLRVRVKRLRYASEALEALVGDEVHPVLRRLVRLQDALGEHQDAVTQVAWLRAYAGSAQLPPATLLAMGAVVDRLERRAEKLRARVARAWSRFDRRRTRRVLLESLRQDRRPRRKVPPRPAPRRAQA